MDTKTLLTLLGVGGIVWWMFIRTPPIAEQVTSGPAETTGAPQPQGVQAYPMAIADAYDLKAFPMGSFAGR